MTVTLLALAPVAGTFVTRDEAGRHRRHSLFGPGPPLLVGPEAAAIAVADHGYEPHDRSFAGWRQLDEYVRGRMPMVTVSAADLPIGPNLAARAPAILSRWVGDPERNDLVEDVALRLLNEELVRGNPDLVRQLVEVMSRARSSRTAALTEAPLEDVSSSGASRADRVWRYYERDLAAA